MPKYILQYYVYKEIGMSSKQKTIIGIFATFLILAVIGLSIGIILVARSASLGSSVRVQYTAKNVDCTIRSTAQLYDGDGSTNGSTIYPTPDHVKVEPLLDDSVTTAGAMAYADEIKIGDNGEGYVIFTITITNDANTSGTSRPIMAVGEIETLGENLQISIDNSGATSISAGNTATILVQMNVMNKTLSAKFEGTLKITVNIVE